MYNTFYCTNCGSEVRDTESYCPICGTKLQDYASRQRAIDDAYEEDVYNPMPINEETAGRRSSTGSVIAIIGALFMIASVFLPFISYNILRFGESISLMDHDDGIILLVAAIIALVLFALRTKILSLIVAVIMCGMTYFEYQNTMSILSEMGILSGVFDKGIGFYGLIIGTMFIALGAVINLFE